MKTMSNRREIQRVYRHRRTRKKISGHPERPRVCIHRSVNHLYAQMIDDTSGKILLGMSTLSKDIRTKIKTGGNVAAATVLGEAFAAAAMKKGVKKISFDRGGNLYHGRVKAFAEAARKAGMEL